MICVNPDLEIIRGKKKEICAGALALQYEKLGGKVKYFGKPYKKIYQKTLEKIKVKNKIKKNNGNFSFYEHLGSGIKVFCFSF